MAVDTVARALALSASLSANVYTKSETDTKLSGKADLVNGAIPLSQIPPAAIERIITVTDDIARFKLTETEVQLGDTVKVTATNKMYFVTDTDHLDGELGYQVYVAGKAAEAVADQNGDTIDTTYVKIVSGKQLSTEDYTTAEKTKLAGIETGANKTTVDDTLNSESTNPVMNKAVTSEIRKLSDVRKVLTWKDVQNLVRSGRAKNVFGIGDQLVCKKGDTTLVWDVIGIDHDEPTDKQFTHSMTLQLHDCLSAIMQYDAPEALYYAETELAAGTYCFTIQDEDATYGGNKTYNFTLTKPVPAGGQITFGWSYQTQAANAKINTYESRTSTTVIETVGVTEGSAGISLGTTDGNSPNVNHIHRVRYGSNNPLENAMRQFLNSDKAAGAVWTPQTNYDRPPSWAASTAGFMNGLDSDFLAVLGKTHKVTCLNTITDGGGSVTQDDTFFLLSRSEVFCGNEVAGVFDGEPYPYYSDYSDYTSANTGADKNRIKYRNGTTAQIWWLRTPYAWSGSHVHTVSTTGNLTYYNADGNNGVAPACNII